MTVPPPDVGATIGSYRITRRLPPAPGRTAFLAEHTALGREAVFTLFAVELDTPDARASVARAVRAAMRLSHPALATVYDYGEYGSQPYLMSQHVPGGSLRTAIRSEASAWSAERVRWLTDLCDTMAVAHAHGVLHGALSPESIVVDGQGTLRVLDVGLSAILDLLDGDVIDAMGGHGCRPPEQIAREPIDARVDVFAMGAVACELLTGVPPFGDGAVDTVVRRVRVQPPDVPRDLDGEIRAVLIKALQKAPEHRFADARALRDALAGWSATHAAPSAPASSDWTHAAAASPVVDPQAAAIDTASVPVPDEQIEPRRFDDNVQFTVFRPRAVAPGRWHTMLVFTHLSERRSDASPDDPDPVEEVLRQAESVLGDLEDHGQQTVDSLEAIPLAGLLTLVPRAAGVEFNPPARSFQWLESVHRESFRLRAAAGTSGRLRGRLSVFRGSIIVADIALVFTVHAGTAEHTSQTVQQAAHPYRKIFASYSHRDGAIVEEFSQYARALGDRYLRDVVDLRAGERWQPALEQLIREADVFQLFWSWHALSSAYVRQEWQYALRVGRAGFVRPVYWDEPMPAQGDLPPEALRALHFERIGPGRHLVQVPADRVRPRAVPPPVARAPAPPAGPAPVGSRGDPPHVDDTVPAPAAERRVGRLEPAAGAPHSSPPSPRRRMLPGAWIGAAAAIVLVALVLPLTLSHLAGDRPAPADGPFAIVEPGDPGAAQLTVHVAGLQQDPSVGTRVEVLRGGEPAAGVTDGGDVVAEATTDAAGTAQFDAIPPGTYQLRVSAPGRPQVRHEVRIEENQTLDVRVTGM